MLRSAEVAQTFVEDVEEVIGDVKRKVKVKEKLVRQGACRKRKSRKDSVKRKVKSKGEIIDARGVKGRGKEARYVKMEKKSKQKLLKQEA
ncbi:hypothetical protein Pmani_038852 [Petrolisthes manimaculis]|uniref:Uncharacterized protein n=1 Tax=Petrolisthes manimaculis TaxID=1843537 RepID=A0AAE1NG44_9EUCA|nr:hypothetical protein Pmani_038852 [Petrolisthes manimaculis]